MDIIGAIAASLLSLRALQEQIARRPPPEPASQPNVKL